MPDNSDDESTRSIGGSGNRYGRMGPVGGDTSASACARIESGDRARVGARCHAAHSESRKGPRNNNFLEAAVVSQ